MGGKLYEINMQKKNCGKRHKKKRIKYVIKLFYNCVLTWICKCKCSRDGRDLRAHSTPQCRTCNIDRIKDGL